MKKQMRSLLTATLFILTVPALMAQPAQREYRTMLGHMVITGQVGDSTLMMRSDRLVMALDYETAEVTIGLNKKSVTTGFDTSRQTLTTDYSTEILFKGRLGIDYVITQKHPPLDFKVEGNFYNGDEKQFITGSGHLEHIHGDEYACVLNLSFQVDPELLGINWPGEGPVRIRIIQTVLKRESD